MAKWTILGGMLVLLLVAAVGYWVCNTRTLPHHSKGTSTGISPPAASTQAAPATIANVVAAWEEAAAKARLSDGVLRLEKKYMQLPKRHIEIVSAELTDVLQIIDPHPTAEQIAACKVSFERIIESHNRLLDERHIHGCARWIAWCAAEAFRRPDMSANDKLQITEGYAEFAVELTAKMRQQIMDKIPKSSQAAFAPKLDKKFATLRHDVDVRIKELQDDFLFPAFREPLSEERKEKILKRYDLATLYPDWAIPTTGTPDEWYQGRLESWFRDEVSGVMFLYAIGEVQPRFRFNEFWGHVTHTSISTDSMWPLQVGLEPDKFKNDEMNWQKKSNDK